MRVYHLEAHRKASEVERLVTVTEVACGCVGVVAELALRNTRSCPYRLSRVGPGRILHGAGRP